MISYLMIGIRRSVVATVGLAAGQKLGSPNQYCIRISSLAFFTYGAGVSEGGGIGVSITGPAGVLLGSGTGVSEGNGNGVLLASGKGVNVGRGVKVGNGVKVACGTGVKLGAGVELGITTKVGCGKIWIGVGSNGLDGVHEGRGVLDGGFVAVSSSGRGVLVTTASSVNKACSRASLSGAFAQSQTPMG